jgi:hypothetical protein
MKKIVFIVGITAAVILLAMGCSNPTSSSSESLDSGNLGTGPLTLSGTIHEEVDPTMEYQNFSYPLIDKAGTLMASTGGTPVQFTSGSFEIEVGTPTTLTSVATTMGSNLSDWADVEVSGSANGADLIFTTSGTIGSGNLKKQRTQLSSVSETGYSGTYQMVQYFYVDADVTITGGEATDSSGGTTTVYKAFTLNLQEGWNAVYMRSDFTVTMSTDEETVTLNVGIPGGLYWVLD